MKTRDDLYYTILSEPKHFEPLSHLFFSQYQMNLNSFRHINMPRMPNRASDSVAPSLPGTDTSSRQMC